MAIYDLTQGRVGTQLTRMTIPYFLGVSSMIFASMIETIYIGILGARELAAYSFMFPVIMALTSVSMGLGIGASSLVARAEGAGDREQVKRIATHTAFLTLLLTFTLSGSTFFFLEFLYSSMGAEGEVLRLVVDFAEIWVVFGLFTFTLPMVSSTVLRALGIAKAPGYIMTITSGVQLIVSPVLIFGLFGVPAQGLMGSAYGFVLIGVIRIFAFAILVAREKIMLTSDITRGFMDSAKSIMHIALPSMLSNLIGPVSMGITLALLANHGDEIVAAFGIASRFEMLLMMILGALSSSVAPFVGQNWGARQVDRIHEGLKLAYGFCLFWGVVCMAMLGPFGDTLVALINEEPQMVKAAALFLLIVPISFGPLGVGQVAGSVFVALGKPMPPTILSIARTVVVYLPMAFVFDHFWGYPGIFVALLVSNILFGLTSWWWGRVMLAQVISQRA
ncbi:MAG: MATE family efflux transporter [Pseudomonadales bacterium]|nr:MATE family efflux transporter [Pseudomonadales bacterium]